MKIIVFGAGAIGSFFGGLLSKKNNVTLVCRKQHADAIKSNGLKISGKTDFLARIDAVHSVDEIDFVPDLLIFTVKSFDTDEAIKSAVSLMGDKTLFLSLQNGLDNIEKIRKNIDIDRLGAGITTHGVIYHKPGFVKHTGIGDTVLGMINKEKNKKILEVLEVFNSSKLKSVISDDIQKNIWIKGIINSSINPLTSFFDCKNGYLLENPVLNRLVEEICYESTCIANSKGIDVNFDDVLKRTKSIIRFTSDNYSSMLQSVKKNKKTEIESINGKLVEVGIENGNNVFLNKVLVSLIKGFD